MSDITQAAADTLALSDVGVISWGVPRTAFDTLALSDAELLALLTYNIQSPADQLSFVDSINVRLSCNHPVISDTLALSDATDVLLALRLSLSDSLSLVDAVSVSGAGILDIGRSGADALAFSDSLLSLDAVGDFIGYIRRYLNDIV